MPTDFISFDEQGFIVNGTRQFLHSADFYYFRVPKSDWRHRMEIR